MAQKPEIQYVERFYVYGSEVPAEIQQTEKEEVVHKKEHLHVQKIYIDLSAILWTLAAVVLMATMILSGVHLTKMSAEKDLMQDYVSFLQTRNAALQHNYRISYDLEEIEKQAAELGLVPEDQVENRYIRVSVPEHEEKWTFFGNIKWFFAGLFE